MNNKGSVLFYGLMLGLTIIILGMALAPAVLESTNSTMSNIDCSNSSISNFDKATCIATDITLPYFIGTLVLIGGAVITARIIFS